MLLRSKWDLNLGGKGNIHSSQPSNLQEVFRGRKLIISTFKKIYYYYYYYLINLLSTIIKFQEKRKTRQNRRRQEVSQKGNSTIVKEH